MFLGKASRRHNENADDAERGRRRGYKRSHARRLEFQTEELKEAASNAQSQEDEEIRCSFESMQFEDAPEEFPTADENDENDDFSHYDQGDDNEKNQEQETQEWNDVGVIESWIGKPTRTRYKVRIVTVNC